MPLLIQKSVSYQNKSPFFFWHDCNKSVLAWHSAKVLWPENSAKLRGGLTEILQKFAWISCTWKFPVFQISHFSPCILIRGCLWEWFLGIPGSARSLRANNTKTWRPSPELIQFLGFTFFDVWIFSLVCKKLLPYLELLQFLLTDYVSLGIVLQIVL